MRVPRRSLFILVIALVGISIGYASSDTLNNAEVEKCEKYEENAKSNGSYPGTLACVEPGVLDVNLSEKIRNNSELECVCRHSYKGSVQIIPISISN